MGVTHEIPCLRARRGDVPDQRLFLGLGPVAVSGIGRFGVFRGSGLALIRQTTAGFRTPDRAS